MKSSPVASLALIVTSVYLIARCQSEAMKVSKLDVISRCEWCDVSQKQLLKEPKRVRRIKRLREERTSTSTKKNIDIETFFLKLTLLKYLVLRRRWLQPMRSFLEMLATEECRSKSKGQQRQANNKAIKGRLGEEETGYC